MKTISFGVEWLKSFSCISKWNLRPIIVHGKSHNSKKNEKLKQKLENSHKFCEKTVSKQLKIITYSLKTLVVQLCHFSKPILRYVFSH